MPKQVEFSEEDLKQMLNEKKKQKRKRRRKKRVEFSKVIVIVVLLMSCRWVELTYKLASQGQTQIAERLAIVIVTTNIATILGYYTKSYKEKNSKNKYLAQLDYDTTGEYGIAESEVYNEL